MFRKDVGDEKKDIKKTSAKWVSVGSGKKEAKDVGNMELIVPEPRGLAGNFSPKELAQAASVHGSVLYIRPCPRLVMSSCDPRRITGLSICPTNDLKPVCSEISMETYM